MDQAGLWEHGKATAGEMDSGKGEGSMDGNRKGKPKAKSVKAWLDVVMTICLVILMKTNITGLQLHEVLGIAIFVLFLLHKWLNIQFIKAIGKNIFSRRIQGKPKCIFWFDLVLLVVMTVCVGTGIVISDFANPFHSAAGSEILSGIHKRSAWWMFLMISIHIGFHLDRLAKLCRGKLGFLKGKAGKTAMVILYLVVAVFGVIALGKQSIYSKLLPISTSQEVRLETPQRGQGKHQAHSEKRTDEELPETVPTLEEYLSQFQCDGCRKHCSLQNPRCETGRAMREEKTAEYYAKYGNREDNPGEDEHEAAIDHNIQENRKNKNKGTLIDAVCILVLFAGAAHYASVLLERIKKRQRREAL